MADVVNEDFAFSVTQNGAATPGITSGGLSDLSSHTKASKAKENSKFILITSISQATPHTAWGCKSPKEDVTGYVKTVASQGFTMNASLTKVKCDGNAPLKKGDIINCTCAGSDTNASIPVTEPFVGSCQIEITDSGQNKVSGV